MWVFVVAAPTGLAAGGQGHRQRGRWRDGRGGNASVLRAFPPVENVISRGGEKKTNEKRGEKKAACELTKLKGGLF